MAVDLEIMRRLPGVVIVDDAHIFDGSRRFVGTGDLPENRDDRLRSLIERIPAPQAVEDGDEGPGYGPPLPPASERLKRKAQWKQETAWSRRK